MSAFNLDYLSCACCFGFNCLLKDNRNKESEKYSYETVNIMQIIMGCEATRTIKSAELQKHIRHSWIPALPQTNWHHWGLLFSFSHLLINPSRRLSAEQTVSSTRRGRRLSPLINLPLPPSVSAAVLHDNKLTHTDLKPENILFVNSDYSLIYNAEKVRDNSGRERVNRHVK